MIGRRHMRVIGVAFASAVSATYLCAMAGFTYFLSQAVAFTLAGLVLVLAWRKR